MFRWENCPGSVRQNAGVPDGPSSPYAQEGTVAHDIAALMLLGNPAPSETEPEMLEAVSVYVDLVRSDPGTLWVEQRLDLSSLYPGLFGTADAITWDAQSRRLRVYDYKHGAGVPVEVEDNAQLMYYAVGAARNLARDPLIVELIIVQPRCYHPKGPVRRWSCDAAHLRAFEERLLIAARRTEDPAAPLNPGAWCRWCKSASSCSALERGATALAVREFSPALRYDPQRLADTLEKLPIIEAWVDGVRAFAKAEAERGRCPPGYELVESFSRRSWADVAAARIEFKRAGLSEDEMHEPRKLISPAKMEKKLPKDKLLLVELFSNSVSNGYRLVAKPKSGAPHLDGTADTVTEFTAISSGDDLC